MENKVTAKDVAREAGVSVATVSYVMNNRSDQKISPETRKKVLQIANLLNYIPSHAAKSLATGRNNAVGISYPIGDCPTKNAGLMTFINSLIERLNRLKYDVTYIPIRKTEELLPVNRNIDAIIAIDLTQEDFRSLADSYLVPVICVDMIVNDTLFYQVYEDIPFLIQKAVLELERPKKCYMIYDSCSNSNYEDFVLTLPENIFPLRHREITPSVLSQLEDGSVIIVGGFLASALLAKFPAELKKRTCAIISEKEQSLIPSDIHCLINNDDKKANVTINIVLNSLNRIFDVTHDCKIR